MTTSLVRSRAPRGVAVASLVAALWGAAVPAGGARAAGAEDLDLAGAGVEFRALDARAGDAATLRPGDLGSLLRGRGLLGGDARRVSPAVFVPAVPSPAWSTSVVPAAAKAVTLGPNVSGLRWRSGASCGVGAFETWRGRRLDVTGTGIRQKSFELMLASLRTSEFKAVVTATPQAIVNIPLLPKDKPKQFAACAKGSFDTFYRQMGGLLVKAGAGQAILRLGWEANIGSRSHPWGIDTAADIPNWVKCFRRAAAQLKLTAPGVKIEWTNAKASVLPVSDLAANPGDDVTDLWGLHYYDANAQFRTQAAWDTFYSQTRFGGPQGMGTWLAEAKRRGKLLGIPEWGVWAREVTAAEADNPLYIQNMYKALKANAATIAYENYYNCPLAHRLHPDSPFPKASAAYRRLWLAGK